MEMSGAPGSRSAKNLIPTSSPSDKRSKKSDDEASDVDAEVQEAAKGLEGGESMDLLQGEPAPAEERAPEETSTPE